MDYKAVFNLSNHAVYMFDKFHLMINFTSKVSCDVSKNENECQLTFTFFLNCHLNATCGYDPLYIELIKKIPGGKRFHLRGA